MDYIAGKINLTNPFEVEEVEEFLGRFDLDFEKDIDYTVAVRKNGNIVATCSKAESVLKCFAVDSSMQGEGVTNIMIKNLQDKLFEEGAYDSFIFTKPEYKGTFLSLGYAEVERSEKVVLMEAGFSGIKGSLEKLGKEYRLDDKSSKTALVMNCNPFTLGHRYLIEEAAKGSTEVIIFVVEEEKSVFPFSVRYNLVKKGVEDLTNVKVVPGGNYIISSATFPGYFLRGKGEHLKEYTTLDAKIFGRYFCKTFNIEKRMVGEEPYCEVTKLYNETLEKVLAQYGVKVDIIKRKVDNVKAISASRVRGSIKGNKGLNIEELEKLIPKVTLDYLGTFEGKEIIKKIIKSSAVH